MIGSPRWMASAWSDDDEPMTNKEVESAMRILVVEDEPRLAALLQRGFGDEGHVVDVVGDGPLAVHQACEFDYDAIVLDWMLPGISGIEVCAQLRRRGCWAAIIMLTARTDVSDRIAGLDAGADDYLIKPFSFAELTARIRALLRRAPSERQALLRAGELTMDPASHRVMIGPEELSLSAKEFAVLELLVRNKNQVLSRTRILDHAWDFAFEPASNVVDQYVGYLRRKIGSRTDTVEINTVRGVGYRLDAPHG